MSQEQTKWSWCRCARGKLNRERCGAICGEPLLGSVVEHGGHHWHVGCLLNHLTSNQPVPFNPYGGIIGS